jgi:hypothetical protein
VHDSREYRRQQKSSPLLFDPWHSMGESVNDAVSYLIAKGNK